jgi:hypothetical protein
MYTDCAKMVWSGNNYLALLDIAFRRLSFPYIYYETNTNVTTVPPFSDPLLITVHSHDCQYAHPTFSSHAI